MVINVRVLVCIFNIIHLTEGIGSPTFQLVPNGILFSIADDGYQRFAVHFNINKPLPGALNGDYSKNFYEHEIHPGHNMEWTFPLKAQPGETYIINYWLLDVKNFQGETLTGQTITLGPMMGQTKTPTTVESATTVLSTTTVTSTTTVPSTTTVLSTTTVPSTRTVPSATTVLSYNTHNTICQDNDMVNCKDQHVCYIHHLRGYCPLTCGICAPPLCEDSTAVHCEYHTVCLHFDLRTFCPLTCGQCVKSTKPPCTDGTLVNCSFAGVCVDSALKEHCPLTCGLCGKLSKTTRWIHIGTTKKPSLSQIIGR